MGSVSTRSSDSLSPCWGASSRLGRQLRNSEPNPATWAQLPHPPVGYFAVSGHGRRANATSSTWTSSNGDWAGCSDTDDVGVLNQLAQEYNRLASKHGIRPLTLENCSHPLACHTPRVLSEKPVPTVERPGKSPSQQRRRSWFLRTFFRQVSATSDGSSTKSDNKVKNKRSVSDLALHLMSGATRKDNLKDENLQSLVRLCGKSKLYLPSEYSPGSLLLPTCFRATAQYLVQHGAETRGVFRIPGSVRVVNALYNYYCADGDVDEISSTIRCPNLPSHLEAGTHDVASTFKRLLSGLPGGILGSLSLFDALVAVHSQLDGEAELTMTKQTKLRARLIALAIGTTKSQLRRDLICAVFGLLCLIGRTAETAPREDEYGRPLPTSGMMGYSALGIVFGPLLIGDLLNSFTMKGANLNAALLPSPPAPLSARKERRRSETPENAHPPGRSVDKVRVANNVTEMLITHWREVVRQMKSFGASRAGRDTSQRRMRLLPSASEPSTLRMPPSDSALFNSGQSSAPPCPTPETMREPYENTHSSLVVPRRRPKAMRPLSSSLAGLTVSLLSPPAEEPSPVECRRSKSFDIVDPAQGYTFSGTHRAMAPDGPQLARTPLTGLRPPTIPKRKSENSNEVDRLFVDAMAPGTQKRRGIQQDIGNEAVRSSKPTVEPGSPCTSVASVGLRGVKSETKMLSRGATAQFRGMPHGEAMLPGSPSHVRGQAEQPETATENGPQDTPAHGLSSRGSLAMTAAEEQKAFRADGHKIDALERRRPSLSAWRSTRRSHLSTDSASPVPRGSHPDKTPAETDVLEWPRALQSRRSSIRSESFPEIDRPSHPEEVHLGRTEGQPYHIVARREDPARRNGEFVGRGVSAHSDSVLTNQASNHMGHHRFIQPPYCDPTTPRISLGRTNTLHVQETLGEIAHKVKAAGTSYTATVRASSSSPREDLAQPTTGSAPRSRPTTPGGSTVKAMAAMFESASNGPQCLSPHQEKVNTRAGSVVLSPYTVNPSPVRSAPTSPKIVESIPTGRRSWFSAVRGRRLREPRETMAAERPRKKSGSRHRETILPETMNSDRTAVGSGVAVLSGSETTVRILSAVQGGTPKGPRTLGPRRQDPEIGDSGTVRVMPVQDAPEIGQGTSGVPKTITPAPPHTHPTPEQQPELATPQPRLSNHCANSPRASEEACRTPLPRRFPLMPATPERQEQQEQHTSTAPVRVSPQSPAANTVPKVTSGTESVALTPKSPSDTHFLHKQPTNNDCVREELSRSRRDSNNNQHDDTDENGDDGPTKHDADINQELATLRERLRQAELECAMWREVAERAERRVQFLERASEFEARADAGCPDNRGLFVCGGYGEDRHGPGHKRAGVGNDAGGGGNRVIRTGRADGRTDGGASVDGCRGRVSGPVEQRTGDGEQELIECLRGMSHVVDGQWDA